MSDSDVIILSSDDEEPPPVVKKPKPAFTKPRKSNNEVLLSESASSEDDNDVVILESFPKRTLKIQVYSPLKTNKSKPSSVGRTSSSDSSNHIPETIPAFSQKSTSLFETDKVRFDRQAEFKRKQDRRKAALARLTAQDEALKLKEAKKKEQEAQLERDKVRAAEPKNKPQYITIYSPVHVPDEPERGIQRPPSPVISRKVQESWTDYSDRRTGKPRYVANGYRRDEQFKPRSVYDQDGYRDKNPIVDTPKIIHYKRDRSPRADLYQRDPSPDYQRGPRRSFYEDARRMERSEERHYVRPISPRYEPPREQCRIDSRRPTSPYFITSIDDIVRDYISRQVENGNEDSSRRSFYQHRDFSDNGPSSSERYHREERYRCPSPSSHHDRNYVLSLQAESMRTPRREQPFHSLPTRDREERVQCNRRIKKEEFDDEYEQYSHRPRDERNNNVSSWLSQNAKIKAEPVDDDEDSEVDYPPPKAKRMRTHYITVPPKRTMEPLNRDDLGPPPDGIHFNFPTEEPAFERHPVLASMADAVERALPNISEETHCNFKMGSKQRGCEWVWVNVDGSPEHTLNAKYAINEWILNEQESVRPVFDVQPYIGKIFVDVPLELRGFVFGERKRNIKNLETGNVRISDNRRRGCFDKSPPLTITGKIPYVRETCEKLKKLIEEAMNRKKNAFKVSLKVPGSAIGAIMGLKGENIRKLIQETHVHVELDPRYNENQERTIHLYGEQSQIDAAMAAIQKHVDGSGPCPLDEGIFHVLVPSRKVGWLIGNRGGKLRWIAERSSAKCHIVFDKDHNATAVCSGGLVEAEFAKHLVQVVIRDIDAKMPFQMTDLGNLSKVAKHERKHLSEYYLNHPLNGQTYRSKDE